MAQQQFTGTHLGAAALGGVVLGVAGTLLYRRMMPAPAGRTMPAGYAPAGQAVTYLAVQYPWLPNGQVAPVSAFYHPQLAAPPYGSHPGRFITAPVAMRARVR